MKRILKPLAWLLLITAVILLLMLLNRTDKLLDQADIPWTDVRGVLDSETWTDWLNYTDGYDWVILRVGKGFTPPAGWTHGTATLREISPTTSSHYFHTGFIQHSALPETFTHWLYIPHNDADDFAQRAWFAAMYDENSGILALYHGHDLWGF